MTGWRSWHRRWCTRQRLGTLLGAAAIGAVAGLAAAAGPRSAAREARAAPANAAEAAAAGSLAGVWQVRLRARTAGGNVFCRAVPVLREAFVDTVWQAADLRELLVAVIPDSLQPAYRAWCVELPAAVADSDGGFAVHCQLPLVLVAPCSLTVEVELAARAAHPDTVRASGVGDGRLHGPGFCPQARCPGTVALELVRLADLPRGR